MVHSGRRLRKVKPSSCVFEIETIYIETADNEPGSDDETARSGIAKRNVAYLAIRHGDAGAEQCVDVIEIIRLDCVAVLAHS